MQQQQRPIIIPRLIGGLGNQLWIVAAAYAIQQQDINNKVKIYLPDFCENPHKVSPFDYYLLFFKDFCSQVQIPHQFLKGPKEFMELALQIGFSFYSPQKISSHEYWSPSAAQIPCLLEGYFQNYPIIAPYLPAIRNSYLKGLTTSFIGNRVGIHVRRGDYMEKPEYHYILGNSYYEKALQHFQEGNSYEYLIFSDDPDAADSIPAINNLHKKIICRERDEVAILTLMSSCKGGMIIANSTFSWWGAILAEPYRVIAPSHWSAQSPTPEQLFPGSWIVI